VRHTIRRGEVSADYIDAAIAARMHKIDADREAADAKSDAGRKRRGDKKRRPKKSTAFLNVMQLNVTLKKQGVNSACGCRSS